VRFGWHRVQPSGHRAPAEDSTQLRLIRTIVCNLCNDRKDLWIVDGDHTMAVTLTCPLTLLLRFRRTTEEDRRKR
jgi:hypothetical protein